MAPTPRRTPHNALPHAPLPLTNGHAAPLAPADPLDEGRAYLGVLRVLQAQLADHVVHTLGLEAGEEGREAGTVCQVLGYITEERAWMALTKRLARAEGWRLYYTDGAATRGLPALYQL